MTDYEDMPVDDDGCDSAQWGGRLITSMKPLSRLPWEEEEMEKKRDGNGGKVRLGRK